ncbi:hypothetical protein CUA59_20585, partial [Shigella flexneri]
RALSEHKTLSVSWSHYLNGEIISLNNCSVFRARHNNQPVGQCLRSFEGKMKIFPGFRYQT